MLSLTASSFRFLTISLIATLAAYLGYNSGKKHLFTICFNIPPPRLSHASTSSTNSSTRPPPRGAVADRPLLRVITLGSITHTRENICNVR
ncbi:hypothetical protein Tco_0391763 [Tanacetum coccineum]